MCDTMSNGRFLKKPTVIFFEGNVQSYLALFCSPASIKTVPNGTTPVQSLQQIHQKIIDTFTLALLLLTLNQYLHTDQITYFVTATDTKGVVFAPFLNIFIH